MMGSTIDAVDALLLHRLHGDFPLSERPFDDVARELELSESEVLDRLVALLDSGMLTRFGPLYQIERAGGSFVLAAMQVPEARFDAVAAMVNGLAEVAHNNRREHRFNMWFVIACARQELADATCRRIEQLTGLPVFAFPKEKEFFVELRLAID